MSGSQTTNKNQGTNAGQLGSGQGPAFVNQNLPQAPGTGTDYSAPTGGQAGINSASFSQGLAYINQAIGNNNGLVNQRNAMIQGLNANTPIDSQTLSQLDPVTQQILESGNQTEKLMYLQNINDQLQGQYNNNNSLMNFLQSGYQAYVANQTTQSADTAKTYLQYLSAGVDPDQLDQFFGSAHLKSLGLTPVTDASGTTPVPGTVGGVTIPANYATDSEYATKIGAIYSNLTATVSDTSDSGQMDSYIQSVNPNAPVSGDQIISVAQQAGIDPGVLASQAQLESANFSSNVSLKDNNLTGVNWDPENTELIALGATQGTPKSASEGGGYYAKFQHPLDSLTWTAQDDSKATAGTGTGAGPNSAQKYQAGGLVGNAINNANTFNGKPYLTTSDLTGYSSTQKSKIAAQAASQGIKVITNATDITTLANVSTAQDNMNDWQNFMTSGNLLPANWTKQPGQYADVTLNEFLATNNELAAFNTWKLAIPNLLKGLGGSGSARLFQTIGNLLPEDTDTVQEAADKFSHIQDLLNNEAAGILGNSYLSQGSGSNQGVTPATGSGNQQQNNGSSNTPVSASQFGSGGEFVAAALPNILSQIQSINPNVTDYNSLLSFMALPATRKSQGAKGGEVPAINNANGALMYASQSDINQGTATPL
jgi:hypothetical protein